MPRLVVTLSERAVFSRAAVEQCAECDRPDSARDAETEIDFSYRFEAFAGGRLALSGGVLGSQVVVVDCDVEDLNLVATLLIDGIKVSAASPQL